MIERLLQKTAGDMYILDNEMDLRTINISVSEIKYSGQSNTKQ